MFRRTGLAMSPVSGRLGLSDFNLFSFGGLSESSGRTVVVLSFVTVRISGILDECVDPGLRGSDI